MGLKKSYFKGLQNGVNSSPIRQDGVDKKYPNIVNEVANDNLVNPNFNFPKTLFPSKINPRSTSSLTPGPVTISSLINTIDKSDNENLNDAYKNQKLELLKEKYPDAKTADLEAYLFSNKPGLKPSEYATFKQTPSSDPRLGSGTYQSNPWPYGPELFSDANLIKDGLIVDDTDGAGGYRGGKTYDLAAPNIGGAMFGMNDDEKLESYYNQLNKIDQSTKKGLYEYNSKKNIIDHYTDPIYRDRFLNQAQTSGTNADGSDLPGSLMTQGDLDMMLNSMFGIMDDKYEGGVYRTENDLKGGTMGQIATGDRIIDRNFGQDFKSSDFFNNEPSNSNNSNFGNFSQHNLIDINKGILPGNYSTNIRDPFKASDFKINSFKAAGPHENIHQTNIDRAMDAKVRSTLKESDTQGGMRGRLGQSQPTYNMSPGEMYANFYEFRELMDMKSGEQFDMKSFKKRIKDKNIEVGEGNDFLNDFTAESLINALNTIADADKKTPGQTKFNDLKMMESNMNTEMA